MSGIAALSAQEFQRQVLRFRRRYVEDWDFWRQVTEENRAALFGSILRKWAACRPNRMRRCRIDRLHTAPFLESLIERADPHVRVLSKFNIARESSFTNAVGESLDGLWSELQHLSYHGRSRGGLAGVVGISKAVMLLTDGRVGPAFDSKVRRRLGIAKIGSPDEWLKALQLASADIRAFEAANGCRFSKSIFPPQFSHLHAGRVYDMALGPG